MGHREHIAEHAWTASFGTFDAFIENGDQTFEKGDLFEGFFRKFIDNGQRNYYLRDS